jgi:hypothetical protein
MRMLSRASSLVYGRSGGRYWHAASGARSIRTITPVAPTGKSPAMSGSHSSWSHRDHVGAIYPDPQKARACQKGLVFLDLICHLFSQVVSAPSNGNNKLSQVQILLPRPLIRLIRLVFFSSLLTAF